MRRLKYLLSLLVLTSCGETFFFHRGKKPSNDQSYVYALPYPKGISHLLVQGYHSGLSHKHVTGLDFAMKSGSTVTAARAGVVYQIAQSYNQGGLAERHSGKGNQIVIIHSDGSRAYYRHLYHQGAVVKVGDFVKVGQIIARSGSTGYSAFPHLHFMVDKVNQRGVPVQMPTRFAQRNKAKYLRPGRWYKAHSN